MYCRLEGLFGAFLEMRYGVPWEISMSPQLFLFSDAPFLPSHSDGGDSGYVLR